MLEQAFIRLTDYTNTVLSTHSIPEALVLLQQVLQGCILFPVAGANARGAPHSQCMLCCGLRLQYNVGLSTTCSLRQHQHAPVHSCCCCCPAADQLSCAAQLTYLPPSWASAPASLLSLLMTLLPPVPNDDRLLPDALLETSLILTALQLLVAAGAPHMPNWCKGWIRHQKG